MPAAGVRPTCCSNAPACCYRHEIEVEALARLRAHQAIARLRAQCACSDPQQVLEIERRLYRLRTIEDLEPPFALIDAGRLLAGWTARDPGARAARASRGPSAATRMSGRYTIR